MYRSDTFKSFGKLFGRRKNIFLYRVVQYWFENELLLRHGALFRLISYLHQKLLSLLLLTIYSHKMVCDVDLNRLQIIFLLLKMLLFSHAFRMCIFFQGVTKCEIGLIYRQRRLRDSFSVYFHCI